VSRALVYNYFGDRGGLMAAVDLRSFRRLDEELNDAVDPALPPYDRIRGMVHAYLSFARKNSSAWHLIAAAGTAQHPAVQDARRARMERMGAAWGGGPSARIVARGVVGMLEAATLDWLESQDADLDELADVLSNLIWTGLSSLVVHGISMPARSVKA
jgi:AcrR family transcriptional regulator